MADGNTIAEGTATLQNTCLVIFELADKWSDGWDNSRLHVVYSDGTPAEDMYVGSQQAYATYERRLQHGSHVTLTWQSGSNWDSECSYTVSYEDGTVILSKGPQGGSFDVSCGYDETYNPVSNLNASVNGFDVTLSWTAPAGAYRYRIARNGITLGETSATNYTDQLHDDMTYTYSVTAIYSGGESMPENLLVEFDWGVNEAESNFSIYPNPADDAIYINGGNAEFNYSIYNSIGQQVTCGSAKGSQKSDVSSLAKGIYIMKIYSNGNVTTRKIAVR